MTGPYAVTTGHSTSRLPLYPRRSSTLPGRGRRSRPERLRQPAGPGHGPAATRSTPGRPTRAPAASAPAGTRPAGPTRSLDAQPCVRTARDPLPRAPSDSHPTPARAGAPARDSIAPLDLASASPGRAPQIVGGDAFSVAAPAMRFSLLAISCDRSHQLRRPGEPPYGSRCTTRRYGERVYDSISLQRARRTPLLRRRDPRDRSTDVTAARSRPGPGCVRRAILRSVEQLADRVVTTSRSVSAPLEALPSRYTAPAVNPVCAAPDPARRARSVGELAATDPPSTTGAARSVSHLPRAG